MARLPDPLPTENPRRRHSPDNQPLAAPGVCREPTLGYTMDSPSP